MDILDIQFKLQDTAAAIAKTEAIVARRPNDPVPATNLRSLHKRQAALEAQFLAESAKRGRDVCAYRVIPDGDHPTIAALTSALSSFQVMFARVYDAIKNGPKERARLSPESVIESAFNFGYAYPGSIGILMTLPNERLLLGGTKLDQAMDTVFSIAAAETSDEIAAFARELGVPPIRAAYVWADAHATGGLSADIEWMRSDEVRNRSLIQRPDLERLKATIEQTSEETEEDVVVVGELVGAEITRRTFHLEVEGGGDIRGTMDEKIGHEHTVELPKRYRAVLKKRSRIHYSIDKEEITYHLLSLSRE